MKTTRSRLLGAALFLACSSSHALSEHGTADEAVAMVQKVIAAMKTEGQDKVIATINDVRTSKYRDRDLYVAIYDLNGKNVAHGSNPRMQGKEMIELKDSDGRAFVRERVEIAKTKGKGWQDYKFLNPVSGHIEPKSAYIERYQNLIVTCGIYK